jgi:hypothetical protein
MIVSTYIYSDDDTEILVDAEVSMGMKGGRDEFGRQMEPDDEPEVEILEMSSTCGSSFDEEGLQSKAKEAILDEITEGALEDYRY